MSSELIKIWKINIETLEVEKLVKMLTINKKCHGLKLDGASGLERVTYRNTGREEVGSLLEFFADRGAILDEKQQRTLAKLRKKREEEERAEAEIVEPPAKPNPAPRSRRKKPPANQ
jgi:hypothetical protein